MTPELQKDPAAGMAFQMLMRVDDYFHRTLVERYHFDPLRYYHTFEHIVDLFKGLDKLLETNPNLVHDIDAIELAILFHDVVYDAEQGAPQNEYQSADLFMQFYTNISKLCEQPQIRHILYCNFSP